MNRPARRHPGLLDVDELRRLAASTRSPDSIDEVLVGLPDLQGRLQGSGASVDHFIEDVLARGLPACAYLLAVDVEMDTDAGYAFAPWDTGFGDFRLVPDLATLRRAPWHPRSAVVFADAWWPAGGMVRVAPRAVLRAQLDRLYTRGLAALAGTELEFLVFTESYQQAADRSYGGLTSASRYNVDYSLIGTSEMDGLVRTIRRAMADAGVRVESARAEVHPGQYEIVFRYDDAMSTCDNHVLYKTTAKNLAAQAGQAVTFMAKYDQGEGNSCHVHLSLRGRDGATLFAAEPLEDGRAAPDEESAERADLAGMSKLMRSFVAGQLACMAEFALLFAPTVNSYKRLAAPGSFAPTGIAWGRDNRTCPVRVVGSGRSLRIEHRVPGGDANPYLAVAGIIAAGLYGIDNDLALPPATAGNAFTAPGVARLPRTLRQAQRLWRSSEIARAAFGDDVVDHLAHAADAELASYETTVTDWERRRAFERL
ncbi:glutamine synthetase family protein [Protofrankia coriariae]|uniref:Glutamate--ammonia ligase n=1 Tax=Protofrankia coriariae TaxID=1562887 RepID=A0ABR5EZJ3_9ACTN|nr:glutamine synthetase family protein [Protofrankia coriariae]KLL09893.1 glutamate--ammonia ligase [Protofrankia coriariae]